MKLVVNQSQRYAKMRAHTATHLLHAELGKIFTDTKQAGSLVESDLLRFDFYADRLLTEEELSQIEEHINLMIYIWAEVKTEEMSIAAAAQLWAKMFFEEKYGDTVRVVQIAKQPLPSEIIEERLEQHFLKYDSFWSIELCGGTHVDNIREIWMFTIISQEAVASWIKRIIALTGPKVREKLEQQAALLMILRNELQVKSFAQLPEKATKLMKELTDAKSQLESMETQLISSYLKAAKPQNNEKFDVILQIPSDFNFKVVGVLAKQEFTDKTIFLYSQEGSFMILTSGDVSAKTFLQELGLKGGGNDLQAQGRDPKVQFLFS